MLMAESVGSDEMIFTGQGGDKPESEQLLITFLQADFKQAKVIEWPMV